MSMLGMSKGEPLKRRSRRVPPELFVGEWLRALNIRPADVARAADVNEGYLSQIINKDKKNPSPAFLMDLASALPQPFEYTLFYQRPPDMKAISATAGISPAILAALVANKTHKPN
jgi:transcriptional regulator with XRE-family HTH domain